MKRRIKIANDRAVTKRAIAAISSTWHTTLMKLGEDIVD
jgi:hypothetical protein